MIQLLNDGRDQRFERFEAAAQGWIAALQVGDGRTKCRRRFLIRGAIRRLAGEEIAALFVLRTAQVGDELLQIDQKLPRLRARRRHGNQMLRVVKRDSPNHDEDEETEAEDGPKFRSN